MPIVPRYSKSSRFWFGTTGTSKPVNLLDTCAAWCAARAALPREKRSGVRGWRRTGTAVAVARRAASLNTNISFEKPGLSLDVV